MIYFSWTIRSFSNDNSDGRDNALPHILPVATLTLGARGFLAQFPVLVMSVSCRPPSAAEAKRSISVHRGQEKTYGTQGTRGGLMVSTLVSGASGPGSSPGRGPCVVFLGKTLYSHGVSLHLGV